MNFPVSKERLNIMDKMLAISKGMVLRIVEFILKGPLALLLFREIISLCTSAGVVASKKNELGCLFFKNF